MASDSAWAILEQKYWPEASDKSKYLGAVVKNYLDPSNRQPDDPTRYIQEYDPAGQRVKPPRELIDFVLKSKAESTLNVEGKLTSLFGATVVNTRKAEVDLSSKRILLHTLDQDEIYWNEVKKDEDVQETVPLWIKKARRPDQPEVCLIIGVAICEGMEVEWEDTRIEERKARGDFPIDKVVTVAAGSLLPIDVGLDVGAKVAKKDTKIRIFKAKQTTSSIFALKLKAIEVKGWFWQPKTLELGLAPKIPGQQLGDESDGEDEDDDEGGEITVDGLVLHAPRSLFAEVDVREKQEEKPQEEKPQEERPQEERPQEEKPEQ